MRKGDYDVRMIDEDSNKTPEVSVEWGFSEPTDEDSSLPHTQSPGFTTMKEYLRSEFEKKVKSWERERKIGGTYLHFAAYLGDVDATKVLIENNADVNAVDEEKFPVLHYAAQDGHVDVAKTLIQNGADVNAVDNIKSTPLGLAA